MVTQLIFGLHNGLGKTRFSPFPRIYLLFLLINLLWLTVGGLVNGNFVRKLYWNGELSEAEVLSCKKLYSILFDINLPIMAEDR